MAITVRHDPVESIQKLSVLAGKAKASERTAQRNQQLAAQAQQMQYQKEMAQYQAQTKMKADQMAMDWELQKLQLNSIKDFEREQMRLDALTARELAKEIKEKDEFELVQRQIREADYLTPEEKEQAISKATMQRFGYSPSILPKQEDGSILANWMRDNKGGVATEIPGGVGGEKTPPPQGISQQQQTAEAQNKLRVISPTGVVGSIPASEWAEHKKSGYELEDMSMQKGGLAYTKSMAGAQESIKSLNPAAYFKAKTKMDELRKKYPAAFKKYIEDIKTGRIKI